MARDMPYSPFEEHISRLERELEEAREAIVGLMPEAMAKMLGSYHECNTRAETREWEHDVLDKIIAAAQPLPEHPYFGTRAHCPLCGSGPQSFMPGPEGFTVPEGLSRHLTGYGRVRTCVVTNAAFALARDYWNRKFRESEEQERKAEAARLIERRKNETLYRTAPDLEPELSDQHLFSKPRSAEEFEWAEQRLVALGFRMSVEGNVKSYTLERETFVVYADPRDRGRIEFAVFPKPLPKRTRRARLRSYPRFQLPDAWKHDLSAKFEARLAAETKRLA